MSLVYAVVADLFFADRLGNGLRQLGHEPQVCDLSQEARPIVPPAAALAVVDLEAGEGALAAIRDARALGLPVLAFGPHMDLALRDDALAAGATRVVAKSKLVTSLAELVAELIKP